MIKVVYRNMSELFGSLVRKGVVFGYKGNYLVVIDERLNIRERMNVLKHEIAHVLLNHLEADCTEEEREQREAEADEYLLSDADVTAMIQAGKIQVQE